jgi:hypothetical protein
MPPMHLGVFVPFIISRATLGFSWRIPRVRGASAIPRELCRDESSHHREAGHDHAMHATSSRGPAGKGCHDVHIAAAETAGDAHLAPCPDRGCHILRAVDDYVPICLRQVHDRGQLVPRDAPMTNATGGSADVKPRAASRQSRFFAILCSPKNTTVSRRSTRRLDRCRIPSPHMRQPERRYSRK